MDSPALALVSLGLVELGLAYFFWDAFKYYLNVKDLIASDLNFQNRSQFNRSSVIAVEGVVKTDNWFEAPLSKAACVGYQIYLLSTSGHRLGKLLSKFSNFELMCDSGIYRLSGSNFLLCGPVTAQQTRYEIKDPKLLKILQNLFPGVTTLEERAIKQNEKCLIIGPKSRKGNTVSTWSVLKPIFINPTAADLEQQAKSAYRYRFLGLFFCGSALILFFAALAL